LKILPESSLGILKASALQIAPLTGSADVPRPAVRIVKNSRPKRVFSPDRDKKSGVENHAAAQIIR
jgi:hypothetical protein